MTGKILVTGSRGFIGSHLCKKLDELNIPYVGFSGDITNFENVLSQLQSPETTIIYHLAGISNVGDCEKAPDKAFAVNTLGTFNIVEAIKRTKIKRKLIFFSTAHVYDTFDPNKTEYVINEESPTKPQSVYAMSKLEAENTITNYFNSYEIGSALIIRLFNHSHISQIGPFFFPQIIAQINQLPPTGGILKVGNIDVFREFGLVNELVETLVKIEPNILGKVDLLNVSSGNLMHLGVVIEEILKNYNKRAVVEIDPSKTRINEPRLIRVNLNKLNTLYKIRLEARTEQKFIQDLLRRS